jgi:hypothetical protein
LVGFFLFLKYASRERDNNKQTNNAAGKKQRKEKKLRGRLVAVKRVMAQ